MVGSATVGEPVRTAFVGMNTLEIRCAAKMFASCFYFELEEKKCLDSVMDLGSSAAHGRLAPHATARRAIAVPARPDRGRGRREYTSRASCVISAAAEW